jgi:putative intracellular protease/amidase
MLLVWSIFVHVGAWYNNTFHDPAAFTQTAHLDTVTVKDAQGHQSQARAFIDPQNHLDLLIIPGGDTSRARIIVGPPLTSINDPQHKALLTVRASGGTLVTVLAQGPLLVGWLDLTANRQSVTWNTDASQQPSRGGK